MKKLFLLLSLFAVVLFAKAQEDQQPGNDNKRQQEIEALKVAFISRDLQLTPAEAQQFWPVYDQYSRELSQTIKDDPDILDRDERVLNIRKRYKDQFIKIIGPGRLNQMFTAEGRFHQLLIRAMRRQERAQENHPFMRRQLP